MAVIQKAEREREGGEHESLKGRKYWIIPERAGDDEE